MRALQSIFGTIFSEEDRQRLERTQQAARQTRQELREFAARSSRETKEIEDKVDFIIGRLDDISRILELVAEIPTVVRETYQVQNAKLDAILTTQTQILAKLDSMGGGGSQLRAELKFGKPKDKGE